MSIEEHRNDGTMLAPVNHETSGGPANPSRRRFTRAGFAGSGVILTLASRPVLGAACCKSPSGFLSGNASTHGNLQVCLGRSPGYWKNREGSWPIPTNTLFRHVFGCGGNSPYYPCTMLSLLGPQHFDKDNLGMHLVAAYLNAMQGWTPFLQVDTLQGMFNEWQASGTFCPTATVQWNSAEIVDYLKSTQA